MISAAAKRSVVIHGHKTSVRLEDELWLALKDFASSRTTLADLVDAIGADRIRASNLSSTIRAHILSRFRDQTRTLAGPAAATPGASRGRIVLPGPTAALSESKPE